METDRGEIMEAKNGENKEKGKGKGKGENNTWIGTGQTEPQDLLPEMQWICQSCDAAHHNPKKGECRMHDTDKENASTNTAKAEAAAKPWSRPSPELWKKEDRDQSLWKAPKKEAPPIDQFSK